MSTSKAIEAKDKIAKIYIKFSIAFIVIFTTITVCSLFVSALNF